MFSCQDVRRSLWSRCRAGAVQAFLESPECWLQAHSSDGVQLEGPDAGLGLAAQHVG